MKADHILVLEKGRVVEEGTHEELIGHNGLYRRVYDIQMSQDDRKRMGAGVEESSMTTDETSAVETGGASDGGI